MSAFAYLQLLDNSRAVYRAWLGGTFVVIIGLLVPQTMFWGEEEIPVVARWRPAEELPNIWPTTGITSFEMNSALTSFVVGMAKLLSISFTVAGGLRGICGKAWRGAGAGGGAVGDGVAWRRAAERGVGSGSDPDLRG